MGNAILNLGDTYNAFNNLVNDYFATIRNGDGQKFAYYSGNILGVFAGGEVAGGAASRLSQAGETAFMARSVEAGAIQYTKSNLQLGQLMHKAYKLEDVVEGVAMKEFREIPGIRPDFVDFSTQTIYEYKPFNPRAMRQGWRQLNNYKSLFEQNYGGTWKTVLDTY